MEGLGWDVDGMQVPGGLKCYDFHREWFVKSSFSVQIQGVIHIRFSLTVRILLYFFGDGKINPIGVVL